MFKKSTLIQRLISNFDPLANNWKHGKHDNNQVDRMNKPGNNGKWDSQTGGGTGKLDFLIGIKHFE